MAFSAAIEFEAQLDPSTFIINDTSNYASPDNKANISSRTLTVFQSDNSPFPGTTNPINWPYAAGDAFTFSGLTQDLALQIIMTLSPITPQSGSTYSAEADVATTGFLQQGLYNIQVQRLNNVNPASLSDKQYRTNSIDLIIEGQNAQTGVLYSNFTGSQEALDRAQNIINNTQL